MNNNEESEESDLEIVVLPKPKSKLIDLSTVDTDDEENDSKNQEMNSNSKKRSHSSLIQSNSDSEFNSNHKPMQKRMRKSGQIIIKQEKHVRNQRTDEISEYGDEDDNQERRIKQENKPKSFPIDIYQSKVRSYGVRNYHRHYVASPGLNYCGFCISHLEMVSVCKGFGDIYPLADIQSNFMKCPLVECHGQVFKLDHINICQCTSNIQYQLFGQSFVTNLPEYTSDSNFRQFYARGFHSRKARNTNNNGSSNGHRSDAVFDKNCFTLLKFQVKPLAR